MNKHSRNTIFDRHFYLGTESNVLLSIFYYNTPGAFFEAFVQRTGGYTNLLQGCVLLVQKNRDIILQCSFKKGRNTKLSYIDDIDNSCVFITLSIMQRLTRLLV